MVTQSKPCPTGVHSVADSLSVCKSQRNYRLEVRDKKWIFIIFYFGFLVLFWFFCIVLFVVVFSEEINLVLVCLFFKLRQAI